MVYSLKFLYKLIYCLLGILDSKKMASKLPFQPEYFYSTHTASSPLATEHSIHPDSPSTALGAIIGVRYLPNHHRGNPRECTCVSRYTLAYTSSTGETVVSVNEIFRKQEDYQHLLEDTKKRGTLDDMRVFLLKDEFRGYEECGICKSRRSQSRY